MSNSLKFVLSLLALVAIVLGALWIYGGKKESYSTELVIEAPPEIIFPFLAEGELQKKWTTGLLDVTAIRTTDEVVGSVDKVVIDQNGKSVGFENKIIRYELNKSLAIRSSNATTVNTLVYQLDDVGENQTSFTFRFRVANVGLGKFFNPFSGTSDRQEIISADARKLKQLAESESRNANLDSQNDSQDDSQNESIISVDDDE